MTDTVEWGDPILHDGSDKCPEHAQNAPCMVRGRIGWEGQSEVVLGREWWWMHVTHYRLPADHPFYAKSEQPAEEPTCGACRRWVPIKDDPDEGRCHFSPPGTYGRPFCHSNDMACSKFTAKGAGQ